jgi:hypothetical protein
VRVIQGAGDSRLLAHNATKGKSGTHGSHVLLLLLLLLRQSLKVSHDKV